MSLQDQLAASARRSKLRRALNEVLSAVSADEQVAVLIDLLAEREETDDTEGEPAAARPTTLSDVQPRPPVGPTRSSSPGMPPRKRFRLIGVDQGRTSSLLAWLTEHPRAPIGELAEGVYGEKTEATQGKTRSLLAALKGQGRVRRVDHGQWEVVVKE